MASQMKPAIAPAPGTPAWHAMLARIEARNREARRAMALVPKTRCKFCEVPITEHDTQLGLCFSCLEAQYGD